MNEEKTESNELEVVGNAEVIERVDVIEKSDDSFPKKIFPLCLLDIKYYVGIKGLAGVFFWVSLVYFVYGIVHFFMWDNTFWGIVWNIFSKPIYLVYHVSVFAFMYCLTWAIFDLASFKNSFLRLLIIIISIIYIILPVDFIPDITPFVGQADDLLALILLLFNTFSLAKNNPSESKTIEKND